MHRLRRVTPLLVVVCLLIACQASPTPLAPTPTAPPAATPVSTQVQAATVAASATTAATATVVASPTTAPTAVQSTATPVPTHVQAATADAGVLATKFALYNPWGVAFDASGKLYVSTCSVNSQVNQQLENQIVVEIDQAGLLKVYAGASFGFGGDGGPAQLAEFLCTGGLAFDHDGNLYIADQGNNKIRRIEKNGMVSTVAGSGAGADIMAQTYCCVGSFAGDGGPATAAALWGPTDVAFDRQGNLYIADHNNNRVRKVDQQGIITTVAGSGTAGFSGDGGPATAAQLNTETPNVVTPDLGSGGGIAFDAEGNLYIADSGNARVRKIDGQGVITTIAGTGKAGFSGDGGPAKSAQLVNPIGLAFDAEGSLYIADGSSVLVSGSGIRKIDKAGLITTVAGTGEIGFSGDGGLATAATLAWPTSIAFDSQGNLYFTDQGNGRVRKIDKNGIISTVAGDGS